MYEIPDVPSKQVIECERNEKEKICYKKFRPVVGHVGLLMALVLYTVFGGLIFRHIEHPAERARLKQFKNTLLWQRRNFITSVVNNTDMTNFERLVKIELEAYELLVQEALSFGLPMFVIHNEDVNPTSWENEQNVPPEKWKVLQAIFFASTVITTIGYGNVTPRTLEGRVFCILFALIGIPLTLTVIADWGKFLAEVVAKMRSKLPHDFMSCMPSNPAVRKFLGALAAVAFLFFYLSCGAMIFTLWEENWTFFEGFYFCFVTMTTIGFGDLVAENPKYMLLCTIYILLGLAMTSTIIELVRRQYASSWKQLQSLQGVFSEVLKKIGDQRGNDAPMFNHDLRKVLTGISIPRLKRGSMSQTSPEKELEEAIKNVLQNMSLSSQELPKKPIVQIFIYESSV